MHLTLYTPNCIMPRPRSLKSASSYVTLYSIYLHTKRYLTSTTILEVTGRSKGDTTSTHEYLFRFHWRICLVSKSLHNTSLPTDYLLLLYIPICKGKLTHTYIYPLAKVIHSCLCSYCFMSVPSMCCMLRCFVLFETKTITNSSHTSILFVLLLNFVLFPSCFLSAVNYHCCVVLICVWCLQE